MQFLPGSGRVDTVVWMYSVDANETAGEEAGRQLHKNVASNVEQALTATPHKAPTIWPPATHQENYPSQTNQTCRTLLEKLRRSHKWCSPIDPRIGRSDERGLGISVRAAWHNDDDDDINYRKDNILSEYSFELKSHKWIQIITNFFRHDNVKCQENIFISY